MSDVLGNISGLKASQIKALERLAARRLPANALISPEVARSLCEISRELRRQA